MVLSQKKIYSSLLIVDFMDKKIWVIANWKSNKTISEALDWVSQVGPEIPKSEALKVVVCPTFSSLSEVKKAVIVGNFPMTIGVQDLSPYGIGAYTGEEPAELLMQICSLAILGHSERRQNFKETDEMVAQKVRQATENNIISLVCVQDSDTKVPDGCKLVAYEPVWAIGSDNSDTPVNANEVAKKLKAKYDNLQMLYGGSVNSENIQNFMAQENISGVLLGKASLDAEEFLRICKNCVL